jgi:hypothetical protein
MIRAEGPAGLATARDDGLDTMSRASPGPTAAGSAMPAAERTRHASDRATSRTRVGSRTAQAAQVTQVALVALLAVALVACGGSATPQPTLAPAGETTAPDAGDSPAPESPTPTAAGARLTIRATGAAAVCKGFAGIADCAVFYRLQAKNGQAQPDIRFAGDPTTAKTLTAPPDAPATLAPLTWNLRVHLDRVDTAPVLAPATPQQWADRECAKQFVVFRKTTKVDIKVTFNPDSGCSIAVTMDGAPTPKP